MSSKRKKTAKSKGKKKKGGKKNGEIIELREMIEALKKDMDKMHKTLKKQHKRISSLESDNKRLKKSLLMGGGYDSAASNKSTAVSNKLIAPKKSTTVSTDIDASDGEHDNESKDDDSKMKENIKFKEKTPKPVIRRNRPKPKKKASDIKFTFDLNHNKIKSGDNGQSAAKPKTFGGKFHSKIDYKIHFLYIYHRHHSVWKIFKF